MSSALMLLAGFVLLIGGGGLLVRGAAGLARSLGVSALVVGLTVVAFGTSAPELAVNVLATAQGNGEIAFGNVVGSNLANIGLILGIAAILRPLDIHGVVLGREMPMMLLGTVAFAALALDGLVDGGGVSRLGRTDGLCLLLFFAVFLYYTIGEVVRPRTRDPLLREAAGLGAPAGPGVPGALGLMAIGLAALVGGGQLAVDAAVDLARWAGVSEAVIGLSVVAVGTSLPELVTSVQAARKGETDMAVGNVVGSNIFNLLFVGGCSATIRPLPTPVAGTFDLIALVAFTVVLLPLAASQRRVDRIEGLLLLVGWLGFTVWRASSG